MLVGIDYVTEVSHPSVGQARNNLREMLQECLNLKFPCIHNLVPNEQRLFLKRRQNLIVSVKNKIVIALETCEVVLGVTAYD
jgi:hypothetical protein